MNCSKIEIQTDKMIRLLFSVFLVFAYLSSNSQTLSSLGKIEDNAIPTMPEYTIQKIDGAYKILKDSFIFEGNTFYERPNGFITSLVIFNDEKDYIKQYNEYGNLLVTILSDRIINLKVSDQGNYLAFHNSESLIKINLKTYEIDTLQGSFVYSFIKEDLIYYNSEDESIHLGKDQIETNEYPSQFLSFKGKVLVITKQNIYALQGNSLIHKHQFKGRFFDAKLIQNEFYFVERLEKRRSQSFSLYKTSDFNKIILVDRLDGLNL